MELNMTKGSPFKLILKFIFPVLCGNLFYQSYNMIDTIIVGQCLGSQALAAVGATSSISFLVFGLANGMTAGFAIPIAQTYGDGNIEQMKKYVGSAVFLGGLLTAIMTVICVYTIPLILRILGTPKDIFEMSRIYIIMSHILLLQGNGKRILFFPDIW
ncbi:MAG: MATE family efflux transporter [Fusicatenibacter sp.]|nr:MATE family efflux transporter [Fusicatenibacter sp.]